MVFFLGLYLTSFIFLRCKVQLTLSTFLKCTLILIILPFIGYHHFFAPTRCTLATLFLLYVRYIDFFSSFQVYLNKSVFEIYMVASYSMLHKPCQLIDGILSKKQKHPEQHDCFPKCLLHSYTISHPDISDRNRPMRI